MKTLGLIAGNGRFPFLVAEEARAQGYRVVVAGLEKEADPALASTADVFFPVKIGALARLVKSFRAYGVSEAVMAGKVEKVRLFQENVRPDLAMVKVLLKARDFKDDSLLGGIAEYLDREGITILDSTRFVQKAMPGSGVLGKKKPSREGWDDIRFGFRLAKEIAGLDIGQTVAVKRKAVVAIEAIEGTDAAIRRAGGLSGGGFTVVKVAKPKQDLRFDVPAVGMNTMKALGEAGAQTLAFEAEKTLVMDRESLVREADRRGIAVISVTEKELR